ncbi:MAG: ABC transporter permease [Thermoflexales bacterium]|nr:ABC transporter permease [Thermoflexales bacterium]
MSVAQPAVALGIPTLRKRESLWEDAFHRLVRNRAAVVGMAIIVMLALVYIFADLIAVKPYDVQVPEDYNKMPGWMVTLMEPVFPSIRSHARLSDAYPLGADDLGRDLFSRVIYGTRVSLTVALIGPIIALLIGTIYGCVSGFFGGRVDNVMMRFVDVMYAFPTILLIILMMAFFRSSFAQAGEPGTLKYTLNALDSKVGGMLFIFIGLGLTAWMGMARLARGQVLSLREKEFVEAARAVGAGNMRIMFRHILPNILGPLIVAETLAIPTYISWEAFLSFIGLGVNPPTPSWGSMIATGANGIRSNPHHALIPGLALAITMFAFNFLGDGLRDALDPRMRGTQ